MLAAGSETRRTGPPPAHAAMARQANARNSARSCFIVEFRWAEVAMVAAGDERSRAVGRRARSGPTLASAPGGRWNRYKKAPPQGGEARIAWWPGRESNPRHGDFQGTV